MVSINNLLLCTFHRVLDFLFPPPKELSDFLNLTSEQFSDLQVVQKNHDGTTQSLFLYKEPIVRASIHALKYKKNTHVAKKYAHSLALFLTQHLVDNSKQYLLLPVPASKHRRDTYGFNQCVLLCEAMISFLDTRFSYCSNILHRHEGSVSQTKLRRTERHTNVKDAFGVSVSLHNKHVIIIDDVWTTGATINNAKLALLKSGAQSVVAFTIAH